MSRRLLPPAVLALLVLLLGGCAWSNRANRPVWNAFEERFVPQDTTAFYAALPLTLPAGLLCIIADTFVVHPIQVADDAWEDAGDLWNGIEWDEHYYTEVAFLPVRVVGTPVVFVVMFLGRSLFDIPPHGTKATAKSDEAEYARVAGEETARQRALLERLQSIAQVPPDALPIRLKDLEPPFLWTDALDQAFDQALEHGRALDRLALLTYAEQQELPPWRADPTRGLRDPDPVVRYVLLERWPADRKVPDELREALCDDPDDAVRQLARQRWP